MKSIIALSFLVLSTTFVVTLIISLMKMLSINWDEKNVNGWTIIKHFQRPLLALLALVLFIFFILPILEAQ